MSFNEFFEFPVEICAAGRLEMLNLSHNSIVRLPDQIGNNRALTSLILSHNRLEVLQQAHPVHYRHYYECFFFKKKLVKILASTPLARVQFGHSPA